MVTKLLREGRGLLLLVNSFVLLNSVIGWVASQEQEEGRTSIQRKEEVQVLWGTLKGDLLTKGRKPGTLCSRSAPEAPWPRTCAWAVMFYFLPWKFEVCYKNIQQHNQTPSEHPTSSQSLVVFISSMGFSKAFILKQIQGKFGRENKNLLLGFFFLLWSVLHCAQRSYEMNH